MPTLDGRCAVVTGGSRGIGRAIVERLARDGADVLFGYATKGEAARTVEQASGAHGIAADLAEPEAILTLLHTAAERHGAVDILVNNAAASGVPTALTDLTDEEYDHTMAVNCRSVFQAIRWAALHMSDGGRIITISTLNTVLAAPGIALYAGSKGAIEQFTAVAARELGSRGITANVVSPGATDTDLLRSTNSEESLAAVARMSPFGRLGKPADVADVVAFLAGPDARWITGQNIRADGGLI